MKKHLMISVALLAFATGAMAQSPASSTPTAPQVNAPASAPADAPPAPGGKHPYHPWTLEEARKKAHERADKLDKMTETEFEAEKQKHHEKWMEKWDAMTPEEKAAYKARRAARKHQEDTAPAAGAPAAPAAQ